MNSQANIGKPKNVPTLNLESVNDNVFKNLHIRSPSRIEEEADEDSPIYIEGDECEFGGTAVLGEQPEHLSYKKRLDLYGSYDWEDFESRDSSAGRTPSTSRGPSPQYSLGPTREGSRRITPKNAKGQHGMVRFTSDIFDLDSAKSINRYDSPPIIFEEGDVDDSQFISTDRTDRTDRTWGRIHGRYGRFPEIPYEEDEDYIQPTTQSAEPTNPFDHDLSFDPTEAAPEDTEEMTDTIVVPSNNIKMKTRAVAPKLSLPATPTEPAIMRFVYLYFALLFMGKLKEFNLN